jgi:hypothetical protein
MDEQDDADGVPHRWVVYIDSLDRSVKVRHVSDSDGGIAPDLTTTAARYRKRSSPSSPPPPRSWAPYTVTPKPKHMGVARVTGHSGFQLPATARWPPALASSP